MWTPQPANVAGVPRHSLIFGLGCDYFWFGVSGKKRAETQVRGKFFLSFVITRKHAGQRGVYEKRQSE